MQESKKDLIYKLLIIILLLLGCLAFFRTRLPQLIHPEDYIRSCTDFGQYFIEVQDYVQGSKMTELMKVAEEPGIFIIASSLVRITGISERLVLPILSMIMYCIIGMALSILGTRFTTNKRYKYYIGLIVVIIYLASFGATNSQIAGIWRQILGQMYILFFLLASFYKKNIRTFIISSIFISMCLISHTFSLVTILGTLFGTICLNILLKQSQECKRNFYLLLAGIFITLPYLYYVYFGYIHDYAIYLIEYMFGISLREIDGLVEGTNDYISQTGEKNTGFNFLGTNPDNLAPILFYFLNYSVIGLILISSLGYFRKVKLSNIYKIFLLIIIIYTSLKIDFATRALLTLELILIPVISFVILKGRGNLFKLIALNGVFFIGFLGISKGIIIQKYTKNIAGDQGIFFLKENFSNKKNVFFIGSSSCTYDLMGELGINAAYNYHLKLSSAKEDKAMGKLDFTRIVQATRNNALFLERAPVLFDFVENNDVYVIFTERDWQVLPKITAKNFVLLEKPYMELIYSDTSKESTIKLVFRVKKDMVTFTDTPNYLTENMDIIYETNQ